MLVCNFCKKNHKEVKHMVASDNDNELNHICGECVLDLLAVLFRPDTRDYYRESIEEQLRLIDQTSPKSTPTNPSEG